MVLPHLGAHAADLPVTAAGALAPATDGVPTLPRPEATLLDTTTPRTTPVRAHPYLTALRDATRAQHDRLEAFVDAPTAFRSQDGYRDLLAGLYGFHAPLEPRLRAAEAHFPALAPLPRRAHLLSVDLRRLGLDPASLPVATRLPALTTPAETIGALYVIEGSSLGGAVLARLARRELGITAESGAAFFTADADLAARWRQVVETIETAADPSAPAQPTGAQAADPSASADSSEAQPAGPPTASPSAIDGIIAGARATFDDLEAWLCR